MAFDKKRSRRPEVGPRLLSVRVIVVVASVLTVVTLSSIFLLVWPLPLISVNNSADRFNALRTALSIGAAAGAAAAVLLAARRQVHQEYVAAATELDATERRITELYTKAVDQLGSGKPAVRLGGLYSLERLASNNPSLRQTIVDVICAYLRMLPRDMTKLELGPDTGIFSNMYRTLALGSTIEDDYENEDHNVITGNVNSDHEAGHEASSDDHATSGDTHSARQEWQIRIAAQRILAKHLRCSSDPSMQEVAWGALDVDLTDAVLANLDFSDTTLGKSSFEGAHFLGDAIFRRTKFLQDVAFSHAKFSSYAESDFTEAVFSGEAKFNNAEFPYGVRFNKAIFHELAWFDLTIFEGGAVGVMFHEATFIDKARFLSTKFIGYAWFVGTRFEGNAAFDNSVFGVGANFSDAKLGDGIDLEGVETRLGPISNYLQESVYPPGWIAVAVAPNEARWIVPEGVNWGRLTIEKQQGK